MDWIEFMRGKAPLSLCLRAFGAVFAALMFFSVSAHAAPPTVEKVRIQTHQGFTRVVLDTNAPIEPNLFTMGQPHRLVIDLPELLWRIPRPSGYVDSPLVRKYSFGLFQPGVSRLVLILSGPTQVLRRKLSRAGRTYTYEIDLANLPSSLLPERPDPRAAVRPTAQRPAPEVIGESQLVVVPAADQLEVVPASDLPVASTVDPATKSVFRARNFDPDTAQFDLLSEAINGVPVLDDLSELPLPAPQRARKADLTVVPADAGNPAGFRVPTLNEVFASVQAAPTIRPTVQAAPVIETAPPLQNIETVTLEPKRVLPLAPARIEMAQEIAALAPLPPAPLLPPLLPVQEDKADLLPALKEEPKRQQKPKVTSKPEIAAEIEKMKPKKSNRPPLRVVIDPGHGGRDPGTGSDGNVEEKEINLKFAVTLANMLEDDPNYEVFLTREADIRVRLPKRVEFARRKDADLFISIHADWSMNKRAKGATAYTLSEEASVGTLDDLANKRKKGGKVAGVDLAAEREDVARLLVDLARRDTQARSLKFAELVVGEVAKETPVLRRPLRKDNFHVLKAPDMPSVLIELGFLSNEVDRENLQSVAWRLKTAKAVKRAIDKFRHATGARDFANR